MMSTICKVETPNQEKHLATFMERRRRDLNGLCKAPCNRWKKDAFEQLHGELLQLAPFVRVASVGGMIEYAFVLGLLVEYLKRHRRKLSRQIRNDQEQISASVGHDLRVFEERFDQLSYTERERNVLDQVRDEVTILHSALQLNRPA